MALNGHGAINSKGFAQFIGKDMVLAHSHRAQRLHHGQARRASGGVKRPFNSLMLQLIRGSVTSAQ
jgi:hypothetical protein